MSGPPQEPEIRRRAARMRASARFRKAVSGLSKEELADRLLQLELAGRELLNEPPLADEAAARARDRVVTENLVLVLAYTDELAARMARTPHNGAG